jgi:hypothetical protein
MTDWAADPAVQDAIARMRDASAILAQPEEMARAELSTRGLHPVGAGVRGSPGRGLGGSDVGRFLESGCLAAC